MRSTSQPEAAGRSQARAGVRGVNGLIMKTTLLFLIGGLVLAGIGYVLFFKSNPLQVRAQKFLELPIPEGMSYVPDSIAERFIREYAETGTVRLDPELGELLEIVVMESPITDDALPNSEAAYMNESSLILRAILNEQAR